VEEKPAQLLNLLEHLVDLMQKDTCDLPTRIRILKQLIEIFTRHGELRTASAPLRDIVPLQQEKIDWLLASIEQLWSAHVGKLLAPTPSPEPIFLRCLSQFITLLRATGFIPSSAEKEKEKPATPASPLVVHEPASNGDVPHLEEERPSIPPLELSQSEIPSVEQPGEKPASSTPSETPQASSEPSQEGEKPSPPPASETPVAAAPEPWDPEGSLRVYEADMKPYDTVTEAARITSHLLHPHLPGSPPPCLPMPVPMLCEAVIHCGLGELFETPHPLPPPPAGIPLGFPPLGETEKGKEVIPVVAEDEKQEPAEKPPQEDGKEKDKEVPSFLDFIPKAPPPCSSVHMPDATSLKVFFDPRSQLFEGSTLRFFREDPTGSPATEACYTFTSFEAS